MRYDECNLQCWLCNGMGCVLDEMTGWVTCPVCRGYGFAQPKELEDEP